MEPAEIIAQALRDAKVPADAPAHLATVTGGTATTVTVTFDGESTGGGRQYLKTYAGAAVGDRVVMLRVGSTWVAIARVSAAPTSGLQGPVANANSTTGDTYWARSGSVVNVRIWNDTPNNLTAAHTVFTLPSSIAPAYNMYFHAMDSASGTTVPMLINTGGAGSYPAGRSAGTSTLGHVCYITPNGGA